MSETYEGGFEVFQKYRPKAYFGAMAPEEVDPRFSCTNTDFGGDDPAEVTEADSATFDPRENIGEL